MLQTEYAVLKPPGICCDAGVCAKAAGHKVKHASCPYPLLIISSLEAAAGTYLLPRLTASCLAPLCIPNRAGLFKTSTLQEADVTQQFSRRYKQNTLLPRATGKHLAESCPRTVSCCHLSSCWRHGAEGRGYRGRELWRHKVLPQKRRDSHKQSFRAVHPLLKLASCYAWCSASPEKRIRAVKEDGLTHRGLSSPIHVIAQGIPTKPAVSYSRIYSQAQVRLLWVTPLVKMRDAQPVRGNFPFDCISKEPCIPQRL